jgi:hypothetical protein
MAVDYVSGAGESQTKGDDTDRKGKGDKYTRLAQKWQEEVAAARKWMQPFWKSARKCEQKYLDERDGENQSQARVNLFWSNTQVLLSAIYGKMPKADVGRRFNDFDDDVARVAGTIMERILNADMERPYDDTSASMRDATQDRFVCGLGQCWARYEVETEEYDAPQLDAMQQPVVDPATGQPATQKAERIVNEEAEVDFIYWEDFLYSPCRRWRDCRWVAKRVYMSKSKLKERFKDLSDEQIDKIPMVTRMPGDQQTSDDVIKATPYRQAAVWEIWDKTTKSVCWYVEGLATVLDYQEDLLELEGFFPCPQPMVATTLTRAFRPRPDYAMVQDLYGELDLLNAKLSNLQRAVKAAGVYDKNSAALSKLLSVDTDNQLIPVENWSAFTEKGGMKGVCDWLPIDAYVNAITQLAGRKASLEKDLYDVLGISDIMRGTSAASETATAQTLKAQFGGARLNNYQGDVARFVSDIMRIRANIISNCFQPETIVRRSLIDRTADAELAEPAIKMLKDYGLAMHHIQVTSDSLAAPDWESEKQTRTEFMGAVSNFLMAAAPMVQQDPATGTLLIKLLQWGTAGFKGSETIEGVLDQAAKAMEQKAQQPPPPPPPPTPEDQQKLADADKKKAEKDKVGADTERTVQETRLIRAQADALLGPDPTMGIPVPGAPFAPEGGAPFGATPGALPPPGPPQGAPPNGMPMPPPGGGPGMPPMPMGG